MTYLTHDQYAAYGGDLPAVGFVPLEFKARKRIDRLTACRVQAMAEAGNVPEAVRLCMVALIDLENKAGVIAQTTDPSVTSFTTDGYTEHYGNLPNAAEADAQMDKLVRDYLYGEMDDYGVPLLYRGV